VFIKNLGGNEQKLFAGIRSNEGGNINLSGRAPQNKVPTESDRGSRFPFGRQIKTNQIRFEGFKLCRQSAALV